MRKMLTFWSAVMLLATTGFAQTTVTINLHDSYGDGWNGGLLTVAGSDYTIETGSEATFDVDLDDGTYAWSYTPGSWASENSWDVWADGAELFSGAGPSAASGTFTLGGSITPIADIQYSEDAENNYPSPLDGQEVTVSGVVTAVKYNGINIQDSNNLWSGIWIYSGTGSTEGISLGDVVSVTGTVEEYNYLTELVCDAEDITVIGTGGEVDIISIEDLEDVHDEALEGMLVWVEGVCTDADISDYGQWDISDDSGSVQVEDHYVDYQPIEGAYYEMIAVVGQSSYDTGYEVGPIDSSAIWETPPCDDNQIFVEMFDSWGDGWNGNVLTIGDDSLTIETGDYNDAELCLEDGSYVVTCGGGNYPSEVSWVIYDIDGNELLAGGAPFDGVLQLGETSDVLGCTDPEAENYNADATIDDGSCYFAGDSCNIALDFATAGGATDGSAAVMGATEYGGDVEWYSFSLDEGWDYLRISLVGSEFDTKLEVWDECDDESYVAYNDDFDGLQSEVTLINVTAGDGFVKVYGYGNEFGNYTLTIEAYNEPVNPTNLTAEAGVETVQLEWEGAVPEDDMRNTGSTQIMLADIGSNIQDDIDYYNTKKAALVGPERDAHQNAGQVYLKGDRNTRNTNVTIVCDGGSWQSEVSWEIYNSAEELVASGGAPDSMDATLDDDTYLVYGYDSYGDGWNGNYLSVTGDDGTSYLNWTVEGDAGTSQFTIGEQTDFPNILFSDIYYDGVEDALMVDVSNDGTLAAGGFYVVYYLTVPTDPECNNATYEAYSFVGGLAAGETVSTGVGPGILNFVGGYGTYTFGALADWQCAIDESNEDDNTIEAELALVDPFEGVTWNIYRSDAGADFAALVTGHDTQDYLDESVTGDVEYCYYVTQVDSEGADESEASNTACATPIAPVDLPVPTGLVADADGYDVFVSWTAPDLTGYDPALYTPSSDDKEDDISTYIAYDPSDYAQPRQGGDTFDDAVAIDALPYNNTGTTNGYTDDYDEVCPYQNSTSPDVVYSFTPDMDYVLDLSLCGEDTYYDTKIYVYENDADNLAATLDGGAASACNDDECQNSHTNYLSFLPGVVCTAGNTYYIVIDGYGGDAGDYALEILDGTPSPLLGYSVYRDGEEVDMIDDGTVTEWGEFIATVGTYEYYVTAHYDTFGESEPSNSDTANVVEPPAACNPPQNLTAEALGNDVSLAWEAPEGGPGWIGHYNGEFNGGIGTGAAAVFECAAKFGPDHLMDYNGMALTKVAFAPNEAAATYTVMVYDLSTGEPVAVDSSEAFDGADLALGEFHEVELANPITIDWTQELMFGYKVNTTTGYPGGMDIGPAVVGYGDLMNWGGWVSIATDFGLDYNWAIEGFVDYSDEGRSLTSMTPIDYSYPSTAQELVAHTLETPVAVQPSESRVMTNYILYRNGEEQDTLGSGTTTYEDMDVEWGTHEYSVTALYNNSEDCGESEESNVVEVYLMNSPPLGFSLISPSDGYTVAVDENNLDEQVAFIWTASADPDNDPVEYMLASYDDLDNEYDTTSAQTGVFLTYGELAGDAFDDSVSQITYMWNVAAYDAWDTTWSNDDDRELVVDVLLSLDGEFTPDVFALHNNYPNPFNPITNITYDIPEVSDVRVDIYNVTGQRVATLAQGVHEPGRYRIVWNATNDFGQQLSSGMYIYRIVAGDFVSVKKLILMK